MQTLIESDTLDKDTRQDWKWDNDLLNMYEAFGLEWRNQEAGEIIKSSIKLGFLGPYRTGYDGEKVILADRATDLEIALELGRFIACKLYCQQFINEPNYGYDDPSMMKQFNNDNQLTIPGGRLNKVAGEATLFILNRCRNSEYSTKQMTEDEINKSKTFCYKLWEYMLSVVPDLDIPAPPEKPLYG